MHLPTTFLALAAVLSTCVVAAPVAEADPAWHSGFRRLPGQPIGKRDAEADPAWHSGFRRLPGQPIGKRDAEADPAWHSGFRRLPGQPIGKRDVEEETEAVVEDEE